MSRVCPTYLNRMLRGFRQPLCDFEEPRAVDSSRSASQVGLQATPMPRGPDYPCLVSVDLRGLDERLGQISCPRRLDLGAALSIREPTIWSTGSRKTYDRRRLAMDFLRNAATAERANRTSKSKTESLIAKLLLK